MKTRNQDQQALGELAESFQSLPRGAVEAVCVEYEIKPADIWFDQKFERWSSCHLVVAREPTGIFRRTAIRFTLAEPAQRQDLFKKYETFAKQAAAALYRGGWCEAYGVKRWGNGQSNSWIHALFSLLQQPRHSAFNRTETFQWHWASTWFNSDRAGEIHRQASNEGRRPSKEEEDELRPFGIRNEITDVVHASVQAIDRLTNYGPNGQKLIAEVDIKSKRFYQRQAVAPYVLAACCKGNEINQQTVPASNEYTFADRSFVGQALFSDEGKRLPVYSDDFWNCSKLNYIPRPFLTEMIEEDAGLTWETVERDRYTIVDLINKIYALNQKDLDSTETDDDFVSEVDTEETRDAQTEKFFPDGLPEDDNLVRLAVLRHERLNSEARNGMSLAREITKETVDNCPLAKSLDHTLRAMRTNKRGKKYAGP